MCLDCQPFHCHNCLQLQSLPLAVCLLDPVSSVSAVKLPWTQESDSRLLPQKALIMIGKWYEKRRLFFVFQESEYAAWTLVNGYNLNHGAVSVHRLQGLTWVTDKNIVLHAMHVSAIRAVWGFTRLAAVKLSLEYIRYNYTCIMYHIMYTVPCMCCHAKLCLCCYLHLATGAILYVTVACAAAILLSEVRTLHRKNLEKKVGKHSCYVS